MGGPTWAGAIADLNAPNEVHWLPQMMGEAEIPEDLDEDERQALRRPDDWAYFVQPEALFEIKGPSGEVTGYRTNPNAENLRYLGPDYYEKRTAGKTKKWIDQYFRNKISPLVDGDPVWTSYNSDVHKAKANLEPVTGREIRMALDFGRRPAAVFAQEINGRWYVLRELYAKDMGAIRFAPKVKRFLAEHFPGYGVILHGDPKGQDKPQTGERTPYQIFAARGLPVLPAPVPGNNIQTRIDTVDYVLNGMVDGYPRLLISPRCPRLLQAMESGYRYPKDRVTTTDQANPIKDKFSDIADALQYLLIGGGESAEMIKVPDSQKAKPQKTRPKNRTRRRMGRGR